MPDGHSRDERSRRRNEILKVRQIPFTSLLLTGLVPNGKFKESHVGVALVHSEQDKEETILLFAADKSNHFHNVYLRKTQSDTPSCCDLVCFAHKLKPNNGKRKITICLIELKGGEDPTTKASDQILKTYNGIWDGIQEIKGVEIIWKALLISKSSLPNNNIELLKTLPKSFNSKNVKVYCTSHDRKAGNIINLTKFMQTSEIMTVKQGQSPADLPNDHSAGKNAEE